jgi:trk system potassium uptake protein TrkH
MEVSFKERRAIIAAGARERRRQASFGLILVFLALGLGLLPIEWRFVQVVQDFLLGFLFLGGLAQILTLAKRLLRLDFSGPSNNFFRVQILTEKHRKWVLAEIVVCSLSCFYIVAWWLRHQAGIDLESQLEMARYEAFYDAATLTALVALLMDRRSVTQWFIGTDITPGRAAIINYVAASFVGAYLLVLPVSLQEGQAVRFIDALFVSVSALTVTGLSPVDVPQVFSLWGRFVIMGLIQLGGLGIVILAGVLTLLAKKRLSLATSKQGLEMVSLPSVGDFFVFLRRVLKFALTIQGLGAIYGYFVLPANIEDRWFHAIFHAVSAFCNAGFTSMREFGSAEHSLAAFYTGLAVLIFLGGIGFFVLFEIWDWLSGRLRSQVQRPRLSDICHLALNSGVVLLVAGALGIFIMETFAGGKQEAWSRLGHSLFFSVSARTAGFAHISLESLSSMSHAVIIVLMAIGASPMSTAGGMKSTTVAVLVMNAYSFLKGLKWAEYRRSEIPNFILQKAVAVVVLYIVVAIIGTSVLVLIERDSPFKIVFEVISAMSTVGLSINYTPQLSSAGKLVVIVLMLVGRLGLITFIYAGIGKVVDRRYRLPQGNYYIG